MWDDDWSDLTDESRSRSGATAEHVDKFQGAMREMIAAARAMLDIAEEVVDDPRALRSMFGAIADSTNDFVRFAAGSAPKWVHHQQQDEHGEDDEPDGDDGMQRINVT